MQTPNNDLRLLGLRALVLDLVLSSEYTSAEEKLVCSGRVQRCQNPAVLLKWYTNTLRLLAEREEAAPAPYAWTVLGFAGAGLRPEDSLFLCPLLRSREADRLDWRPDWQQSVQRLGKTAVSTYGLQFCKTMKFTLANN